MLFFICIKLVAHMVACVHAIAYVCAIGENCPSPHLSPKKQTPSKNI